MEALPKCFFAYPASPFGRAEIIESALQAIRGSGIVEVVGWKSLEVGGRYIIGRVCESIRASDLFVGDVTGLNPNVLFELGYAIAHGKRVWMLLDTTLERSRLDFEKFELLKTVGYESATNSRQIIESFLRTQPFSTKDDSLLRDLLNTNETPNRPTLLYVPSQVETEQSIRLTREVASSSVASIIDDPAEVQSLPLSWYINRTYFAAAVLSHLLSTEHQNWQINNAKQAFVSGLAYGFGKPVLMLAHAPYTPPLDYHDLLHTCETATCAQQRYREWIAPQVEAFRRQAEYAEGYQAQVVARGRLEALRLGEWIAEYESELLPEYFISTATYQEALHSNHSVFIGRKGTGKSATLYKLQNELGQSAINHVCVIKPVAYDLQGILQLLTGELGSSDQGYIIESLWKFLIYTELTKSLHDRIESKPVFVGRNSVERELAEFVAENGGWIQPEFSVRIESAVNRIRTVNVGPTIEAQRASISEQLHHAMLPRMRALIRQLLGDRTRLIVLIDNLDKAWDPKNNLERVSELIFGLLNVSNRVTAELEREDRLGKGVRFSLILFLRSDIYAAIVGFAHERDKLPVRRMTWDDPDTLLRVLEERFLKSNVGISHPAEIWQEYFSSTVGMRETRKYLTETVLPRPRDLLYLIKAALRFAINRNHGRIEEDDFLSAEAEYSHFALSAILAENAGQVSRLEELLTEFAGCSAIVGELDVLEFIERAGVTEQPSSVIDFLCEITFLGLEVASNRFLFLYNEDDRAKLHVMARKGAEQNPGGLRRFLINRPFHAYLEVQPSEGRIDDQLPLDIVG